MSATKISVGINIVEKAMRGFMAITLSNIGYGNSSEPEIMQGSIAEIGGSLYEFQSTVESITGWASVATSNIAYIELEADASAPYPVTAKWTTTAPAWSSGNYAYYNGDNRTIGFVWKKSATEWEHKFFLTPENHFEFEDNLVFRYTKGSTAGASYFTASAMSDWFEHIVPSGSNRHYYVGGTYSTGATFPEIFVLDQIYHPTAGVCYLLGLDHTGSSDQIQLGPSGSETTNLRRMNIIWWWAM